LITSDGGKIWASHLPVLFDEEANVLRSHMARANLWQNSFSRNGNGIDLAARNRV
jgi:predicted FMN-binding regulatory protein PaiB